MQLPSCAFEVLNSHIHRTVDHRTWLAHSEFRKVISCICRYRTQLGPNTETCKWTHVPWRIDVLLCASALEMKISHSHKQILPFAWLRNAANCARNSMHSLAMWVLMSCGRNCSSLVQTRRTNALSMCSALVWLVTRPVAMVTLSTAGIVTTKFVETTASGSNLHFLRTISSHFSVLGVHWLWNKIAASAIVPKRSTIKKGSRFVGQCARACEQAIEIVSTCHSTSVVHSMYEYVGLLGIIRIAYILCLFYYFHHQNTTLNLIFSQLLFYWIFCSYFVLICYHFVRQDIIIQSERFSLNEKNVKNDLPHI